MPIYTTCGACGCTELVLFQHGDFVLASKAKSTWKIECDALTPEDWHGLAQMAMQFLDRPFSAVYGVPWGGMPLAEALRPWATGNKNDPALVVDDVWTTGGSMRRFITDMHVDRKFGEHFGLVVFARNTPEPWVTALFQMPSAYRKQVTHAVAGRTK